jgi:hypothetical protein
MHGREEYAAGPGGGKGPPGLARQVALHPRFRALREAEEIWEALKEVPTRAAPAADRALPSPQGNAALARTIREASARAAAVDVEEAKELADLALFTARLVPGGEAQRNRAVGFCDGATLKKPVL